VAGVGLKVNVRSLDAAALDTLRRAGQIDLTVGEIGPHGAADPDQFIMSHRSGYLWDPTIPYPEMEALFQEWKQATTVEGRKQVSFKMQALFNRQPTYLALYYPQENWAFRPAAFNQWAESPGYGIVNKWSFLTPDVRRRSVTHEFK
jgi:peptide/nickel transport system substrate-binding protein